MFEVEINGKKHKADVTFYTAYVYEAEFGSKLVQDYMQGADYDEAEVDGEKVAVVKFETIDWMTVMRVLWAAMKTAKDSTPPFEEWMRKAGGADLWDIRSYLDSAITECFFRSLGGGAEGER